VCIYISLDNKKGEYKKVFKKILRIAIMLFIIILFIWWINSIDFNTHRLFSTLNNMDKMFVAVIIILAISDVLFRVIKFQNILFFFGYDLKILGLIPVFFIGFFAGVLTPMKSGEPLKAVVLKKKKKVPLSVGVLSTLLERSFELLSIILFLAITLQNVSTSYTINVAFVCIIVSMISFLSLCILYLDNLYFYKLFKKIQTTFKASKVQEFCKSMFNLIDIVKIKKYSTRIKYIFSWLLLSIVILLINFLIPYTLFISIGINIPFTTVIFANIVGTLLGLLSQSPGGLVATEGIMIYIYSNFGVPIENALSVVLIGRSLFYLYLMIGWLYLIYERRIMH